MFRNTFDLFSFRHFFNVFLIVLRTWNNVVALSLFERDCLYVCIWNVNLSKRMQTKQQSFWYDRLVKFNSLRFSNINLRIHVNSLDLLMIRHKISFIWARFSLVVFLLSAFFFIWVFLFSSFIFFFELNFFFNSFAFVTFRNWFDSATRLKRVDFFFFKNKELKNKKY